MSSQNLLSIRLRDYACLHSQCTTLCSSCGRAEYVKTALLRQTEKVVGTHYTLIVI